MDTLELFKQAKDFDTYTQGQVIFDEGSPAEFMYVVTEGEVDLIVGDLVVETAGPGVIFGEMALIDKKPRSATAKAKTDCQVVPIDEKRFTFLVQATPFFAVHVMRVMALRIRNMDKLL